MGFKRRDRSRTAALGGHRDRCSDCGITFVVVLQLPQIDDREDAEAGAQNCLVVVEWAKRNADAGIAGNPSQKFMIWVAKLASARKMPSKRCPMRQNPSSGG
jgi:hypothetical protein